MAHRAKKGGDSSYGSNIRDRADSRSFACRQQIASAAAWDHLSRRLYLITPYLDAANVDPETKRVPHVALGMTRISLGLEDDFANGMIAKQLIEIAKTRRAQSRSLM